MKAGRILATAWENLTQRKLRASLTTLGVVIGITAIIGLASLGEGFRLEIRERMQQGFELDILIVIPGSFTTGLGEFTPDEISRVRSVAGAAFTTALMTLPKARLSNEDSEPVNALTVAGVNISELAQMLPERLTPIEGVMPSPEENDTVVLGYKACFLNGTTRLVNVGENVTMQIGTPPLSINRTRRVAAILGKSGTSGITNFDYWAFIPTNMTIDVMQGEEAYNIILVKVSDVEQSEQVAQNIEAVFENPYFISILVPLAFMRQVDRILNIVQIFLMAVASISLLVAGIGIMNIMSVSVMERTREIGILKAIGAKSRMVLAMFLSEAVLIGILGGLIGTLTGYGLSFALSYVLSNFIQPQQSVTFGTSDTERMSIDPVFSFEWTIIAFIFSIIVCIIFGLYPARKASKLNPVDALRYE
ncbi:ABC transporter permease [Candidatus Bathyarchaeota archaeon]|nr:ABC transporter permease [Candidatus Bathyarchaeota archaeon]